MKKGAGDMRGSIGRLLRACRLGRTEGPGQDGSEGPDAPGVDDRGNDSATGFKSDSPILRPEQDEVGIDAFARAISRSIAGADASNGLVYAINGVWGAGKSSAVNLVLHHLGDEVRTGRMAVAAFNPWWFSTPEALTTAFFGELGVITGKSLDRRAREALAKVGSRLSAAGPFLGGLASLGTTPAAGAAVVGGAGLFEWLSRLDTTVEKEHRRLAEALRGSTTRYLVVLDDIDRLGTDEALQVFKLVKSAGRLPNVIYLLAYDRLLAERMVAERFPAEGATYLEKVVQGAFDLPLPDAASLNAQVLRTVERVMGTPPEAKMTRFMNLFHDVVSPLLKTPRDAVRLGNAIDVTWPAIGAEVDRADFVALEALRLFRPEIHRAIRSHAAMLVGHQSDNGGDRDATRRSYDATFLDIVAYDERRYVEHALRRLFPRLDAVWANSWHAGGDAWRRDRLACTPEHFPTYFVFGLADGTVSAGESDALVRGAATPGETAATLRTSLMAPGVRGGTRAALLIGELTTRAADIDEAAVPQLVRDVFAVADDLNVEADVGRGFGNLVSNELRLRWLLNALLRDRLPIDERSRIVRAAAPPASLDWLVSLSASCKSIKDARGTERDRGYENLVDDETTEWLFAFSRDRMREAALDGSLASRPSIVSLLLRWRDRTTEDEVRAWTDRQLEVDGFVLAIARDGVQEVWSLGMGGFGFLGDRVSRRSYRKNMRSLATVLDPDRLTARVTELSNSANLDEAGRLTLERFRAAPDQSRGDLP